ncbi:SAM-dependent methyltransferase [Candidatus Nomurabacteria bacterium CG_4_9_14_0_2_um_filter_32_10]|uniref:SAM-dependent methyltransferase n=3 Tax=Candidatus Nomuraibacteriota TaxID=1752729 RepID=A0A2H0CGA8_9BACT|nr:MAG: SAM-dependent methyltransferase [Candidatus Nomurabacteria bacterium CG22_combo_CG10-13_8_21_14_all_32_8]PIZ86406.1 MAG: SAM-dependent methyltransferase [Candidatus Nomurabacteria bacterium CG_4_10_14_0_2_um_filter_33_9]PJC49594.1 MAG: SAM-dependent methyltransferase [Candidatus Nomurabacteria bacterium CG_4_9_14_0_2_um_filter_32_10]
MIKLFYLKNPKDFDDYELLDTGGGEKLEKFGPYTFIRPYEGAVWPKALGMKDNWAKADGKFWSSKTGAVKGWKMKNKIDKNWEMSYKGIKFLASPTPFRHLGFFPEQASHWDFIEEKIGEKIFASSNFLDSKKIPKKLLSHGSHSNLNVVNETNIAYAEESTSLESFEVPKIKFLNLFGYTGVASLFALRAGAEITHIDASKTSIEWAKENQKLNSHLGLEKMPMRIICDDVMKFLEREIKRGNKYDAVIMDPPKFGRGPKGETWDIEKDLPKLLSQVRKILSDKPLFVILNSYATDYSSLSLGYALESAMSGLKGETSSGELCLLEKLNNRVISLSNTAIWKS